MSASLVGSEMCIRDRGSLNGQQQMYSSAASRCVRFPAVSSGFLRAPLPVSYTHLTLPTICSV
eukprot:5377642-Alexandrium_andersonii.AAC.1